MRQANDGGRYEAYDRSTTVTSLGLSGVRPAHTQPMNMYLTKRGDLKRKSGGGCSGWGGAPIEHLPPLCVICG